MWYALYETETGRLLSSGSSITSTIPDGLSVKTFPTRPTLGWNESTLDFDVLPPVEKVTLTPLEFMQRFTVQERIAIRSASRTDHVVEDFLALINTASFIEGSHPLLEQGLGYMAANGYISQERAVEVGAF